MAGNEKTNGKIKNINEICMIITELKKKGKKIITTNGCFDILHIGHSNYLQEAKKLGDVLIVGVNTDSSVKENKGDKRPVNSENARAGLIASLGCVDYVFLFPEKDPRNFLQKIKPNIHVKGADRKIDQIIKKNVVEENGGKFVLIPIVDDTSTTSLINKIIEVYKH